MEATISLPINRLLNKRGVSPRSGQEPRCKSNNKKAMDRESFAYDGSVEEVPSSNGWLNSIPVVK
jgi:hypothetical protein